MTEVSIATIQHDEDEKSPCPLPDIRSSYQGVAMG